MNNTLIPREHVYSLNRKFVNIYSSDRDVLKWPKNNNFEITLPQTLTDVQSIFLSSVTLPIVFYTFSDQNKNTKMKFEVSGNIYSITIDEGFYEGPNLAIELENKMNDVTNQTGSIKFLVKFNSVNNKIYILHTHGVGFSLMFDEESSYDDVCGLNNYDVFNRCSDWGLGYNLGFDKKRYQSVYHGNFKFGYTNDLSGVKAHVVTASYPIVMFKNKNIYMELDKYNTIDELSCLTSRTDNLYNNNYSGKVNAFFAKLSINTAPYNEIILDKNNTLDNISIYNPPIEKISKLKFKFRYHDGTLVDFKNHEFSFVIGFNSLQNEIPRNYNIRLPATLNV